MSDFFLLEHAVGRKDIWVDEYEVPDAYDFDSSLGASIPPPPKKPVLSYANKIARKTDYLAGIFSFPVVSARFRALLESTSDPHLEFLPLRLVCRRDRETDASYHLLNLLDNVPCFDWERSEFDETMPGGTPFGVTKLCIHEAPLEGRSIARIAELPSVIVVRASLRDRIDKEGLTGVELKLLSAYSEYP